MTETTSRRSRPSRSGPGSEARRGTGRPPGRFRWRRIPGRIILAACFLVGAAALGAAVLPFTTTDAEGVELRCGPAVFEVLMPPDPAFDDVPENAGCAAPSTRRLLIAGGALAGAVLVAAITERRTRRGSVARDSRWLAGTAKSRKVARARSKSIASPGDQPGVGSGSGGADPALPTPRR